MENRKNNSIRLFSLSGYLFYNSLLIGWQLVSFIYLYQNSDQGQIAIRLNQWSVFQPYFIGVGIIISILILLPGSVQFFKDAECERIIKIQIYIISSYIGFLLADLVLYFAGISIHIFRLVIFFMTLWILNRWGNILYKFKIAAWQHPTTYGSFIIAAFLNGCAISDVLNLFESKNSLIAYFILVFLLFDLMIIYARFKFLSRSHPLLSQIARKLLGSQILLFGMRIIIGIFMPLIFILYSSITNDVTIEGIGVLILIGTALAIYLFVYSGVGNDFDQTGIG